MFNRSLTYGASAAAILLATSGAAFAQETTGGIRGVISDAAGAPVANATVVITHVPSGTSNTIVTNAEGGYYARNLRIGGPYTVAVSSAQGDVQGSLASVNIGAPGVLNLTVSSAASDDAYAVADIVVRGARSGGLQTGPRTRVNAEQIETLPSISRDIKDFARTSPFASIDPTNNDAIILGGQNNRMNAFMVDGTRQGDDFGLASNGYPTVNSPISISVLQAVQVDVAPYDVQYGNFQGGVINSVTKSGGNEFHGELFYETTNDSMQGDEFTVKGMNTGAVKTQPVSGDFEETTWGATLSGPIIKDRLFFLANYEKFEATRPVLTGPTGSGATNEVPFVTQDDVDTVRNITKSIYGYDPLDWSADELTTFDEKIFLKLDWNINDAHRAVVSYQQTEGSILNLNGTSTSNTTPAVGLLSQGYQLQTNLVSYKAQVFSDWTENFSTELAYTRKETENISSNLAGSDFAAMRVMLPSQGSATPSIYLGPERSRHMNLLTNDLDQFRVIGKYTSGANRLTFGYERENLEIYNAFVQAANAEYEFASVADFEAGRASYINYQNAASNNKIDGGASFSYASNVLFFQNEFDVNDKLTLRGGLRYEWYDMDDEPLENKAFGDKYGFRNNYTLDGISLLQPRVGFNYRVDDTFNIYGGFGLFMGGSPNVWVSNNFSNTGNLIGQFQCRRDGYTSNNVRSTVRVCSPEELAALAVTDGTNPAQIAKDKVTESANLGTGVINVIDPKFEMPSIWKFSIGATKDFDLSRWNMGEGWNVRTEYVRSEVENAIGWKDLNMEERQSGTAPDGRPLYTGPNGNQVVLMLTNFKEGFTDQFTIGVNKNWYEGWAEGLGFDLSYTYVDSNDVHPGTSSVAASNFGQMAVFDPNNPELATSNYEIQHSTKLNLSYRRAFFGDYRTSFNLFGERRSGLPYSHTINGANNGEANEYSRRNRMLLYVPTADASGLVTATSDSRVTYAANFDFAGFNEYLQKSGLMKYAGHAAPRNSSKSPDVTKFDLRIAQELPAFFPNGARLEAYLDVENLGNLLNDEWGVIQQTNFPSFYSPVTGTMSSSSFNYTKFEQQDPRGFNNQSVWQVKVGVRYKF